MTQPPRSQCSACAAPAVGQWLRRATDAELAAEHSRIIDWREQCIAEQRVLPDHDFGPLPQPDEVTVAVFGCEEHVITTDLAVRVHAADCTAPHPDHLPACGCTPETLPEPEPVPEFVTLSTGWTVPARSAS